MQSDLVKICPQCGSEFQLRVETCLDCGTALVHGLEGQGAGIAEMAGMAGTAGITGVPQGTQEEPTEISSEHVFLRTAPVSWIRRLSEDLDEAGIGHLIRPPESGRDPIVYVLPSDLAAAARVDRARYAIEVPEVGAGEGLPRTPRTPVRRSPTRAPSSDDHDLKLCPSCGGEYQLWVEKCADCGVPLVRPWELDQARDQAREKTAPKVAEPVPDADPASDDSGLCPACGDPLREGEMECSGCGLILAQPETCPRCGAELELYVSTCRRCGQDLFGLSEG